MEILKEIYITSVVMYFIPFIKQIFSMIHTCAKTAIVLLKKCYFSINYGFVLFVSKLTYLQLFSVGIFLKSMHLAV